MARSQVNNMAGHTVWGFERDISSDEDDHDTNEEYRGQISGYMFEPVRLDDPESQMTVEYSDNEETLTATPRLTAAAVTDW